MEEKHLQEEEEHLQEKEEHLQEVLLCPGTVAKCTCTCVEQEQLLTFSTIEKYPPDDIFNTDETGLFFII